MKKANIFIASSDWSYLKLIQKILLSSKTGYSVDIATNADECIKKLYINNYQLLLLDYSFDNGKSLNVLEQISASGLDIRIIVLIEKKRADIIYSCMENGCSDYLFKEKGHVEKLPLLIDKHLGTGSNIEINPSLLESIETTKNRTIPTEQPTQQKLEIHYILNRKGKFTSVNKTLSEKLGFSQEELLELNMEDLVHPDLVQPYYQWLAERDTGITTDKFKTFLLSKHGKLLPVKISITPVRGKNNEILNYNGYFDFIPQSTIPAKPSNGFFDQNKMVKDFRHLIHFSFDSSLNIFLEKIAQQACKLFQFKRATLALLDRRRELYVKQIMLGYNNGVKSNSRMLEVPRNVVEKIFINNHKVRVLYHDQEFDENKIIFSAIEERRFQKRDPNDKWHPNNVIVLNLADQNNRTFGYISLDSPLTTKAPKREIFHNLKIFSSLTSLAIEYFYRYSLLEKRNRRLKRLLITGNMFKLNMTGSEIMRESVWAVKFSTDFNLAMVGLINSKSNTLNIKSAACDDRIKNLQISELIFPVEEFRGLLRKEYSIGKSYLIDKPEQAIRKLKDIYYDSKGDPDETSSWKWWHTLIIPIYENHKNIIGFLIVDDPTDLQVPAKEIIHSLEILANQLSIALENRAHYLHLKNKYEKLRHDSLVSARDEADSGFKKLTEKFFRQ
ncbi:hypothetical protein B6I21_01325 [candidate division KSB1 bacterium 4572_119]|nr:MAG: hypothetical protein B6I21_01325 [candidate division KSB1 bacterium 4572_119]